MNDDSSACFARLLCLFVCVQSAQTVECVGCFVCVCVSVHACDPRQVERQQVLQSQSFAFGTLMNSVEGKADPQQPLQEDYGN